MRNDIRYATGVLTINLAALQKNYLKICNFCDDNSTVAGVVKADAYGLGMLEVSQALYDVGCRLFYVATPQEGIELRVKHDDIFIYILDGLFNEAEDIYRRYNLIPCLASIEQIIFWQKNNKKLPCVVHFNTGINRLGVSFDDYIKISPTLNIDHILSHFASADVADDEQNAVQIKEFKHITTHFPNYKRSFSNSAAIEFKIDKDIIRPGIGLNGTSNCVDLEPVISLSGRVLQILNLDIGDKIGYNHIYICDKKMQVAVIAVGYADGIFRRLSASNEQATGYFHYKTYKLPILGKISMDVTVVDISELPDTMLQEGNFVEIIGDNISLEMLAEWSQTINYEILTNIGARFLKKYI